MKHFLCCILTVSRFCDLILDAAVIYSFESSTVTGTVLANIGSGGTSYNAQLVNGASISSTDFRIGSASLQLASSSSQYVQIPSFATGTTGLTFACWFRSNGNPRFARLFDFGNGAGIDNILVHVEGDGSLVLGIYFNVSGSWAGVPVVVNDNLWRHFAWTLTPSGTWTVYINGVTVWFSTSQIYPAAISRVSNYLGRDSWNSAAGYYKGAIDDFRMYSRTLQASDVMAFLNGE